MIIMRTFARPVVGCEDLSVRAGTHVAVTDRQTQLGTTTSVLGALVRSCNKEHIKHFNNVSIYKAYG